MDHDGFYEARLLCGSPDEFPLVVGNEDFRFVFFNAGCELVYKYLNRPLPDFKVGDFLIFLYLSIDGFCLLGSRADEI